MIFGLNTKLHTSFEEAVEQTTRALADQGFGVLTTIDVKATLKQKLGEDMEKYVILGACNPVLAHRALNVDRQIGQLLPCNVLVRTDPDAPAETVLVEAMDPQSHGAVGRPAGTARRRRSGHRQAESRHQRTWPTR